MTDKEHIAIGRVDILVAEDSPTQAEQLRFLLEQEGHRVRIATNGRLALESARERRPDLVITDVVMPMMDGYDLCCAIKNDPALHDVPVIIVTSLSSIQDIARSLECGADNFIRKPYDPKTLIARIEYILLNLELRKSSRVKMGLEIVMGGRKHFISSGREQIIDLLISTYDEAVHMNEELQAQQREIALSNRTLRVLYRIAGQLNLVATEAAVCEQALQGILDLPGFRAGWVWLDAGDGRLRTFASAGLPQPPGDPAAQDGQCRCLRHLRSREMSGVAMILDCERLRAMGDGDGAMRHHASIPLMRGDQCLGVMNVVGDDRNVFAGEEIRLLEAIGSQTAVAIQRAQLYEHLEELVAQRTAALQAEVLERTRAEQKIAGLNRLYAVLSAINTTIVRVNDRDDLYREACRIAVELGRFRLAWIGRPDRERARVRPLAWVSRGDDGAAVDEAPPADWVDAGSGLLARAIDEGRVATCDDIGTERRALFPPDVRERGCRSQAVFPLFEDGAIAGVMTLYAEEPGFFGDEAELGLLKELAGDISFALGYIRKGEQIEHLAYYDGLTGLPNRTLIHDRLAQLVQARREADGGAPLLALVMVDIGRFKNINDTFGRHVGDALLKLVGERLGQAFDVTDRLARLGGDHFAIILTGLDDAAEVAHRVARALKGELARPFRIESHELHLAFRFGVALHPGDADDADALFANAETALRNCAAAEENYIFYARDMNARVSEQLSLENRLHRALERDEFVLHYQPKVSLLDGSVVAVEALLRWNEPGRGLASPGTFVPLLEETGLIVEVGRRVIDKALADAARWRAAGLVLPRVAVNVSAVQMRRKDFLDTLDQLLAARPGGREALDIELTESVLMQDIEANIRALSAVREMGIHVAVDDFGTGYSSLSYLKRFPIDQLKIDQSFVRDITTDSDAAAICVAIIGLAHNLRLKVIAEGVESDAQMQFLRRRDCDELQGYLFSRPLPADDLAALLASGRRLDV